MTTTEDRKKMGTKKSDRTDMIACFLQFFEDGTEESQAFIIVILTALSIRKKDGDLASDNK